MEINKAMIDLQKSVAALEKDCNDVARCLMKIALEISTPKPSGFKSGGIIGNSNK